MSHMRTKLTVAALVLLVAVGYLVTAGVQSGWVYYVDIDKFEPDPAYQTQRVRLMGQVAEEDLTVNPGLLLARFTIRGKTNRQPVQYEGVVPDTFEPGVDVVVEGRLDEAGVFQADMLMTKCASKYEEQDTNHGSEAWQ